MSTSVPPSLVSLAQEMDHTGQQLLLGLIALQVLIVLTAFNVRKVRRS